MQAPRGLELLFMLLSLLPLSLLPLAEGGSDTAQNIMIVDSASGSYLHQRDSVPSINSDGLSAVVSALAGLRPGSQLDDSAKEAVRSSLQHAESLPTSNFARR